VSHLHGDHFLGLPWLLHRLGDGGRAKHLDIFGPSGIEAVVPAAYELAYPGSFAKLPFPLAFVEAAPEMDITLDAWRFRFAPSLHSQPNLAVRLERDGAALCYSGDGAPDPDSLWLAERAELLVQESYFLEKDNDPHGASGHGSAELSIELAREAGARRLAMVHIARSVRHGRREELAEKAASAQDVGAFVPEPGDSLTI
jgi:ribonuclease BN (tRNA processing enzyme)